MAQRNSRRCSRCGVLKPVRDFGKTPPLYRCNECKRLERELAGLNDPPAPPRRKYTGKRKTDLVDGISDTLLAVYSLPRDRYVRLREAQRNRCAICGCLPVAGKRLVIDHDHDTGEVRGLLCDGCNHGLGNFQDDPRRMAAAIEYVQRPPAWSVA